jgi:general stress protein 26
MGTKVNDMEQKFCQSCGMPLSPEVLGTNADGRKNEDYCMYCYKNGKFLQDCTMEEMIDATSKEMIWRDGDEEYYPGGVTDPNYCVLKFIATDGRFYSDFYPRSFVIE